MGVGCGQMPGVMIYIINAHRICSHHLYRYQYATKMKKSVIDITLDTFYSFAPLPNVNLAGKTIVIVGANTGLGFEAAKRLAAMGPGRFILGCRSQSKGEVAVRRIQEEVGYDKAEMWLVDLCDFGSVKRFIERVVKKLGRLDLLVLNAAVMQHPGSEHAPTRDGFEEA